jgi:hypothetical protein
VRPPWLGGVPASLKAVLAVHLAVAPPLLLGLRGKRARTHGVVGLGAAFFLLEHSHDREAF